LIVRYVEIAGIVDHHCFSWISNCFSQLTYICVLRLYALQEVFPKILVYIVWY